MSHTPVTHMYVKDTSRHTRVCDHRSPITARLIHVYISGGGLNEMHTSAVYLQIPDPTKIWKLTARMPTGDNSRIKTMAKIIGRQ